MKQPLSINKAPLRVTKYQIKEYCTFQLFSIDCQGVISLLPGTDPFVTFEFHFFHLFTIYTEVWLSNCWRCSEIEKLIHSFKVQLNFLKWITERFHRTTEMFLWEILILDNRTYRFLVLCRLSTLSFLSLVSSFTHFVDGRVTKSVANKFV